jgi:hypothetical protein
MFKDLFTFKPFIRGGLKKRIDINFDTRFKHMNAKAPLMPKAVAVWLIENTGLTFEQIADFCKLHKLEVQALADEEGPRIVGQSPITSNELTSEEIEICEKNPGRMLIMKKSDLPQPKQRSKGPKYTPVSKRGDKPDAIAYILKTHAELSDNQITKLVGTTKTTISAIRDRTHSKISEIKPRHPVDLGLCTYSELEAALEKAHKELEKQGKPIPGKTSIMGDAPEDAQSQDENSGSGFDFSNFLSGSSSN